MLRLSDIDLSEHLPGRHDQRTHGRRGRGAVGGGGELGEIDDLNYGQYKTFDPEFARRDRDYTSPEYLERLQAMPTPAEKMRWSDDSGPSQADLAAVENRIWAKNQEMGVLWGRDGQLISVTAGTFDHVAPPGTHARAAFTFSHNHPNGDATLSQGDVGWAVANGIREVRAVGATHTHSMRFPKGSDPVGFERTVTSRVQDFPFFPSASQLRDIYDEAAPRFGVEIRRDNNIFMEHAAGKHDQRTHGRRGGTGGRPGGGELGVDNLPEGYSFSHDITGGGALGPGHEFGTAATYYHPGAGYLKPPSPRSHNVMARDFGTTGPNGMARKGFYRVGVQGGNRNKLLYIEGPTASKTVARKVVGDAVDARWVGPKDQWAIYKVSSDKFGPDRSGLVEELFEAFREHLAGKHDQRTHGRRGNTTIGSGAGGFDPDNLAEGYSWEDQPRLEVVSWATRESSRYCATFYEPGKGYLAQEGMKMGVAGHGSTARDHGFSDEYEMMRSHPTLVRVDYSSAGGEGGGVIEGYKLSKDTGKAIVGDLVDAGVPWEARFEMWNPAGAMGGGPLQVGRGTVAELLEVLREHLAGKHDQRTHGRRGSSAGGGGGGNPDGIEAHPVGREGFSYFVSDASQGYVRTDTMFDEFRSEEDLLDKLNWGPGPNEAQLKGAAAAIKDSPNERLLMWDAQGKLVADLEGNEARCGAPSSAGVMTHTMMHNHPEVAPPSSGDLKQLGYNAIPRGYVVQPDGKAVEYRIPDETKVWSRTSRGYEVTDATSDARSRLDTMLSAGTSWQTTNSMWPEGTTGEQAMGAFFTEMERLGVHAEFHTDFLEALREHLAGKHDQRTHGRRGAGGGGAGYTRSAQPDLTTGNEVSWGGFYHKEGGSEAWVNLHGGEFENLHRTHPEFMNERYVRVRAYFQTDTPEIFVYANLDPRSGQLGVPHPKGMLKKVAGAIYDSGQRQGKWTRTPNVIQYDSTWNVLDLLAEAELLDEHLPGRHDQRTHGRRSRGGGGGGGEQEELPGMPPAGLPKGFPSDAELDQMGFGESIMFRDLRPEEEFPYLQHEERVSWDGFTEGPNEAAVQAVEARLAGLPYEVAMRWDRDGNPLSLTVGDHSGIPDHPTDFVAHTLTHNHPRNWSLQPGERDQVHVVSPGDINYASACGMRQIRSVGPDGTTTSVRFGSGEDGVWFVNEASRIRWVHGGNHPADSGWQMTDWAIQTAADMVGPTVQVKFTRTTPIADAARMLADEVEEFLFTSALRTVTEHMAGKHDQRSHGRRYGGGGRGGFTDKYGEEELPGYVTVDHMLEADGLSGWAVASPDSVLDTERGEWTPDRKNDIGPGPSQAKVDRAISEIRDKPVEHVIAWDAEGNQIAHVQGTSLGAGLPTPTAMDAHTIVHNHPIDTAGSDAVGINIHSPSDLDFDGGYNVRQSIVVNSVRGEVSRYTVKAGERNPGEEMGRELGAGIPVARMGVAWEPAPLNETPKHQANRYEKHLHPVISRVFERQSAIESFEVVLIGNMGEVYRS